MGTVAGRRGTSGPPDDGRFEATRRALARERRRLVAESEAFDAFARRLDGIDADATPDANGRGARSGAHPLAARTERAGGTAVRRAYAETVMAVPHYDADYGEGYWEHIASEFGPGLAGALRDARGLPAFLKERLTAAARDAAENRREVVTVLDDEAGALDAAEPRLDAARDDLTAVASRPFFECDAAELDALVADLDALRERCGALARRRQAGDLRVEPTLPSAADAPTLGEYLYGETDSVHPVLRDIAALADRIADVRRRVETARATRTTRGA